MRAAPVFTVAGSEKAAVNLANPLRVLSPLGIGKAFRKDLIDEGAFWRAASEGTSRVAI